MAHGTLALRLEATTSSLLGDEPGSTETSIGGTAARLAVGISLALSSDELITGTSASG